jgi:predicted transposase/invertase (TIGR01784 family)
LRHKHEEIDCFMQRRRRNKRENKFDKILRENLEEPGALLLQTLIPFKVSKVSPLPPRIRQHILEMETDTLLRVEPEHGEPFIFHLEFQSLNHPRMAERMAAYAYALRLKYELPVLSTVMYIGNKPMDMENFLRMGKSYFEYQLVDIRQLDAKVFLESENPKQIVLALLAGDKKQNKELFIREILSKLQQKLIHSPMELKNRIIELETLSALRDKNTLYKIIKEENTMPIVYDIRDLFSYQEGLSEGLSQGMSQGLSKGLTKGLSKGESKATLKIAKKMLREGFDSQIVHKCTGLELAELEKLIKKN